MYTVESNVRYTQTHRFSNDTCININLIAVLSERINVADLNAAISEHELQCVILKDRIINLL